MRGLEVATDSTGKAIVRAMTNGAAATDGLGRSAQGAAGDMRNLSEAANRAAEAESHRQNVEKMGWQERTDRRNAEVRSTMFTDKEGFSSDAQGNRVTMGGGSDHAHRRSQLS